MRAIYIQSTQTTEVIKELTSLLESNEKQKVVDRTALQKTYFTDGLPKSLFICGERKNGWVKVEYQSSDVLENWGCDLSEKLKTKVVVLHYLHRFGWGYFALYASGVKKREFAIQDVGDSPFIEENWNASFDPLSEARKDVTLQVEINEGEFPKLDIERSEDFDYLSIGIDLIHQYCSIIGIDFLQNESNLNTLSIDQDVYIMLGSFEERTETQCCNFEDDIDLPF
ncbi:hypothetical protein [Flammeovirga sp. EKP202]|uniref:hypothetical protein n=1 Tax=Flammeovirga sp. EKP202 TaxID=2770592 RepID=UPI00165F1185|nr:hypothetical protein [Flammeovirga sp. EKP202]MBD0404576.1 hypothetical protein [Flammeovirga sp. EKP202]